MSRELTNLLPLEKKRAFRREYFVRLSVVGALLLSAVLLFGAVMLIPSYLSFSQEHALQEKRVTQLEATLQNAQERAIGERLTRLSEDTEHLNRLGQVPSGSSAVRAVLRVARPGIALTGITFSPGAEEEHTMTLSGTAQTREALRAYNLALSELPFVSSSELPISTYAKETDLDFMITLTGTFIP